MDSLNAVRVGGAAAVSDRPFSLQKLAKRIGLVFAILAGLLATVMLGLYLSAEYRLNRIYTIPMDSVTFPTDAQALVRGEHWATLYCADCHGENMAGKAILGDPDLGRVDAPNLTRGKGGLGGGYGVADWIRAIRHGVDREGKALLAMPSADWYNLSDRDLGDMIAYLETIPAVDTANGQSGLTPFGKLLLGVGVLHDVLQAEVIDHSAGRIPAPTPIVSAAYGEYLVRGTGCQTCHGANLTGGTSPDPKSPPAPDISQRGPLRLWSEQVFIGQARTRVSEFMTWSVLNRMTDDELGAMWLYLKSVPGK